MTETGELEGLPPDSTDAQKLTTLLTGAELAKKEGDNEKFQKINSFMTEWYKSGELQIDSLPNAASVDKMGEDIGLDIFNRSSGIVAQHTPTTREQTSRFGESWINYNSGRTNNRDLFDFSDPGIQQAVETNWKRLGFDKRFPNTKFETPTAETQISKKFQSQTNYKTGQSGRSSLYNRLRGK